MFEKIKGKKVLGMPLAVLLILGLVSVSAFAGAVAIKSWNVDVVVDEDLSFENTDATMNLDLNTPTDHLIGVGNVGDGELYARSTWIETENPSAVVYSINYNVNPITVPAHGNVLQTATFTVEADSPVGTVKGHFDGTRVAQP